METTYIPILDSEGACRHVLITNWDITERKASICERKRNEELLRRNEERLRQSQKMDLKGAVTEMAGILKRLIGEHINLALNARDAMPKGGVLTIRASTAFPEEEEGRERLFEPFFTTKAG